MRKTLEQRRLAAVKLRFFVSFKECSRCKVKFSLGKMWVVKRWGINKTIHPWYYCRECMHSAKDVLHEIDTDSCKFGIANVDPF